MTAPRIKTDAGGDSFKFETIGTKLTGHYQGSVDHEGEYGPTKKHIFKTDKGIKVVFGQKQLTDLLATETPGVFMEVTFTGLKKGKKGNPMKTYQLAVYDDNTEAVVTDAEYLNDSANDFDGETDQELEAIAPAPVAPQRPAARPTAASQAKVAALLNRNKTA